MQTRQQCWGKIVLLQDESYERCVKLSCDIAVFGKSHQRQHVSELHAPPEVILVSAVSNWSHRELCSLVETRRNHILLAVLQWLSHLWWQYKQDTLRQCTRPYVHRGIGSDRRGRGTVTFHFHGPWNRLSAGMLASPSASPVCHVKAATNKKRMPIMSCKMGDVTFQAQLDLFHVVWGISR